MSGSGWWSEVSRRRFLRDGSIVVGGALAGSSVMGLAGCRCGSGGEAAADGGSDDGGNPPSWSEYDVRLRLRDVLHMADIDHHGIFIDFGTAARFKYTLGNWRSGWGDDVVEQGISFTWATRPPARAYFHLDEATPVKFIFLWKRTI